MQCAETVYHLLAVLDPADATLRETELVAAFPLGNEGPFPDGHALYVALDPEGCGEVTLEQWTLQLSETRGALETACVDEGARWLGNLLARLSRFCMLAHCPDQVEEEDQQAAEAHSTRLADARAMYQLMTRQCKMYRDEGKLHLADLVYVQGGDSLSLSLSLSLPL
jgi:hypothetical protein